MVVAKTAQPPDSLRVVLLGTGTPVPSKGQFGPSVLIEAGGHSYVIDCGRGCGIRLGQYYGSRNYRQVNTVLLTHFHSDHTVGLPELYLNGWLQQRPKPLRLFGPPGIKQLADGLQAAFAADIQLRTYEAEMLGNSLEGGEIKTIQITNEGIVLQENGISITAFKVDHGHVKNAVGFRVDYGVHSVVISGDTGPSENLIKFSSGADVVIHEVMSPGLITKIRSLYNEAAGDFVTSIHTTAEQAGEIFSKIEPKLAVYYHTLNDKGTREELIQATRTKYSGDLVVGEDLMIIDISDDVSWQQFKLE